MEVIMEREEVMEKVTEIARDIFDDEEIPFEKPKALKAKYEYNMETFRANPKNLDGFINVYDESIKKMKGLDIIAVYVIRNIETNSFYLGLSLDMEKSISKAFSYSLPKNLAMLKEYKNSKLENKSSLFEIKMKIATSKDELLKGYRTFNREFRGKFIRY